LLIQSEACSSFVDLNLQIVIDLSNPPMVSSQDRMTVLSCYYRLLQLLPSQVDLCRRRTPDTDHGVRESFAGDWVCAHQPTRTHNKADHWLALFARTTSLFSLILSGCHRPSNPTDRILLMRIRCCGGSLSSSTLKSITPSLAASSLL